LLAWKTVDHFKIGNQDWDYVLRRLVLHGREAVDLFSELLDPGNKGWEYVLRRVLERATQHCKQILFIDGRT
jgi:alanyl-tRNA synthetase